MSNFDPSELMESEVPFVDPFSFDERRFLPANWEPEHCEVETSNTTESQKQPEHGRQPVQQACKETEHGTHTLPARLPTPTGHADTAHSSQPASTPMQMPRSIMHTLEIEVEGANDDMVVVSAKADPDSRSRKRAVEHDLKATAISEQVESPAEVARDTGLSENAGEGETDTVIAHHGANTTFQRRPGPRVRHECARTLSFFPHAVGGGGALKGASKTTHDCVWYLSQCCKYARLKQQ